MPEMLSPYGIGGAPPELDLLAGAHALPAQAVQKGQREFGAVLVLVGLIPAAIGVLPIWLGQAGQILPVVFPLAIALVPLLGGLHQLLLRKEYRFTHEGVECQSRGLLGSRQWSAPFSDYLGVLLDESERSEGKSSRCTIYALALKHGGKASQDVALYRSLMAGDARARQEEYARLFGVAALVRTDEGLAARSVGELDESVRERVAAGSLAVTFDPTQRPPGWGLSVYIEGDTLRLAARWSLPRVAGGGAFLLFGLAVLLAPKLGTHLLEVVPQWVGGVCVAFGALVEGYQFLTSEELLVSPREVRARWWTAGMGWSESASPTDEIEEVVIRGKDGQWGLNDGPVPSRPPDRLLWREADRGPAPLGARLHHRRHQQVARPSLSPASASQWLGICILVWPPQKGGRQGA